MKATIFFFLFCFVSLTSFSQRANTWYFGNNAGLNFNTNPPTALANGMIVNPDNASSISNSVGSLLFYTDGSTVWNKNHVVMPNGNGLIGNFTAGQCAIIVPVPCDTNKFVIFHVTEFSSPGYLHYTVVDMSLSSGLGDVLISQKNISLGSGWTEKLCAYYNPLGNHYWVLTHKWNSDQFVAFNVSSNAIATQTIISATGGNHNCGTYSGPHDALGQLTISPDGTKVLNAFTCQDKYELFNFNSATGVVSNPIVLPSQGGNAWGTGFSPDSKKIYTNSIFGQKILQYDINNYNQSAIIASQSTLVTVSTGGYNFGYMELGPDNKLYITRPGTNFLAVVNNPNVLGAGSSFSLTGQSLGSKTSTHGLSRIAYNIPSTYTTGISLTVSASPTVVCLGQTCTLVAAGASTYLWSNSATSSTIIVSPSGTSIYTVSGTVGSSCSAASGNATVMIVVSPLPFITISGTKSICPGQSTTLTAGGAQNYLWSTGATTSSIIASPASSTIYSVSGTSTNNCSSSNTAMVGILPVPGISISGNSLVCYGQSVTLTASGAVNYQWSNGSSFPSIVVTPTTVTIYSVAGTLGTSQCSGSAAFVVYTSECLGLRQDYEGSRKITVFPNPFQNSIEIELHSADRENREVKLVNLMGQTVYETLWEAKDGAASTMVVNLQELPSGIYVMMLYNSEGLFTQKIIKSSY